MGLSTYIYLWVPLVLLVHDMEEEDLLLSHFEITGGRGRYSRYLR